MARRRRKGRDRVARGSAGRPASGALAARSPSRRRIVWGGAACLLVVALAVTLVASRNDRVLPTPAPDPGAPTKLLRDVATLRILDHEIEAELAYENDVRSRGLMFRRSLPQDHGMLFLFPALGRLEFYMMNTTLPLTIAFIDDQGKITDLFDMHPDPDGVLGTQAASSVPVRFALEMAQGWFSGHGVSAGASVEIPKWVRDLPVEPE